jgi:uncharacterized lipoprotein YehR (DUF1307 family)
MKKIKMLLSFMFLSFVLVGMLAGCKTANAIPPITIEKTKIITQKEVIHDTVFETKKDSSYYKAWLECQDGKVVIKGKPQKTKGKSLEPPKVNIKDNVLTVDCKAEAQKMFASWKDTYIHENSQTNTSKPVLIEKQFSNWQHFQIWCGRLFLGLLFLILVTGFLRWKNII